MSADLRQSRFSVADLRLDAAAEVERIAAFIRETAAGRLRRRGAVLGISGGIDSSVTAALCVRALGRDRVLGLLMPEAESSPESTRLGELLASQLGIRTILEDVTPLLEAAGCYRRRDEAIRQVVPDYGPGCKAKIVLPGALENAGYNVFSVVVERSDGRQTRTRLSADAYLAIVAATNYKQRVRKMTEYHYADRHQYVVVGTPNLLEYDQGFFVKLGDGAADLKPIAHLYKTQVYQLAEHLDVPAEIRQRPPTTDTYTLSQSQEEFYFALPMATLDLCLFGLNYDVPIDDVAQVAGLSVEQIERVYRDIRSKRRVAAYLHESVTVLE